ncbi:MAG: hypothetical protein NDI70_05840 [Pseudomonas sagittaria]|nr:hypothetical protein [Pseudomonas sagittaria]
MLRLLAVSFFAAILAGCASPSKPINMTVTGSQARANSYDAQLQKNVQLSEVNGGEKTNPLWTSEIDGEDFQVALQQSLDNANLLGHDSPAYALRANLLRVEQPLFGLDFEVTSEVEYTLTEKTSGKVIFREIVRAPFTAGVGDSFMAIKRLRLANEGSARENINVLLKRLSDLRIEANQVSLQN